MSYRIERDDPPRRVYHGVAGQLARAVDAVLSTFAPRLVLERQKARAASAEILNYDAAKTKRWRKESSAGSADNDLLQDLPKIRSKCRSMARDDSNAAAMVRVLEDNVVGTGMRPQLMVSSENTPGLTDKEADDWNRSCEQLFEDWSKHDADAAERLTFYAMQRKALRSLIVDGEILASRTVITKAEAPWRSLETAFELLDVDRLQDPHTGQPDKDIRAGVELGLRMEPVAYWITPRHPDEHRPRYQQAKLKNNRPERHTRLSDRGLQNILHVLRDDRPGQTRGVPFFAPCLGWTIVLNDYIETESAAAAAASRYCGFIKQVMDANSLAANPMFQQQPNGEWHEQLQRNTLKYLNTNEEFQAYTPTRPVTNFEPFIVAMLRSICAALGLPYELVLKNFGDMNYSSARVALLEARRGFEVLQQLMIEQFCEPVLRWVIFDAVVSQKLRVPNGFLVNPRPFLRAAWQTPAWGWVDPKTEVESSRLAVEANLSTPQAEAARQGMDSEQILELRARHLKKAKEVEERYGLEPGSLTRERSERIETVQAPTDGEQQPGKAPPPGGAVKKKEPAKEAA